MTPVFAELIVSAFNDIVRNDPDAEAYLRDTTIFTGKWAIVKLDGGENESKALSSRTIDQLYAIARNIPADRASSHLLQHSTICDLPASKVRNILEVGPGRGVLTALLKISGYKVKTVDVDGNSNPTAPDVIASLPVLPFEDGEFDLTCAFQVLQHLSYSDSLAAVQELARCSRKYILLSYPYQTRALYLNGRVRLPWGRLRRFQFDFRLFKRLPGRSTDRDTNSDHTGSQNFRAHRWELNRKSFPESKLLADLNELGLQIINSFHNPEFPFHFFVLAEKHDGSISSAE
jgi:SAM-dependent methyltransferase